MESSNLQQLFFKTIRNTIPANISMVDEVAAVLQLGLDSVYRRVRGEKPISLAELKVLCDHFRISLDEVLQLQNDSVMFQAPGINSDLDFTTYLGGILREFKYFNSFDKREIFYLCKDLPIWHFFLFKEIAAFKMFCWMKTIQNNPAFSHKIFSLHEFGFDDNYLLGEQILREYNLIPGVELWSYETINSTINQIQYYKDAQLFATPTDLTQVLASLRKMLYHLRDQAEAGSKFLPGTPPNRAAFPYQLYINEVLLGNNTTLLSLDNTLCCYINYNGLNYFKTKDPRFTKRSLDHFNTLISRSTYVSGTGEKYRNKYFTSLEEKVDRLC
jgi:hypothetical protein